MDNVVRSPENDHLYNWFPHIIDNRRMREDLKYRVFIRTEKMRFERKIKEDLDIEC